MLMSFYHGERHERKKGTLKGMSVTGTLQCDECVLTGRNRCPYQFFVDNDYLAYMRKSKCWFETSEMNLFASLLVHKVHRKDVLFDICPYAHGGKHSNPDLILSLPSEILHIICYCWESDHYSLVHVDVATRTVFVHDGYLHLTGVGNWFPNIRYLLKTWNLIDDACEFLTSSCMPKHHELIQPNNSYSNVFRIVGVEPHEQKDASECGPNACVWLWKFLVPEEAPNDPTTYRERVCDEIKSMYAQVGCDYWHIMPRSECQ